VNSREIRGGANGAMEQTCFEFFFFGFSLKTFTELLLYTYLPLSLHVCEDPDRTAHYHNIDILKAGDSSLTQHSDGHRVREISIGKLLIITVVEQVSGMQTRC
jgi:hypothetical protein